MEDTDSCGAAGGRAAGTSTACPPPSLERRREAQRVHLQTLQLALRGDHPAYGPEHESQVMVRAVCALLTGTKYRQKSDGVQLLRGARPGYV